MEVTKPLDRVAQCQTLALHPGKPHGIHDVAALGIVDRIIKHAVALFEDLWVAGCVCHGFRSPASEDETRPAGTLCGRPILAR